MLHNKISDIHTTDMTTPWTKEGACDKPLQEYPRPQLEREKWQCLNGFWQYAITDKDEEIIPHFQGNIRVPFCIESSLSGVQKVLRPDQYLWYLKNFHVSKEWGNQRVLLHFGAVDWEARVMVNGQMVGEHRGGYLPFHYDITDYLVEGENQLMVRVWDPTDHHCQQKGKQSLNPRSIFYTATSGIWQTVWLEPVNPVHIEKLRFLPVLDEGILEMEVKTPTEGRFVAEIELEGKTLAVVDGVTNQVSKVKLNQVKPWSPDSPQLYDLRVKLMSQGQEVDQVKSYFAMRKFSTERDQRGIKRLFLNNKPLFHHGPLDQGYWPDGIYTAPTDEALRYDIQLAKDLGYNVIRKHVKVESMRWYYHCDKMGMIVWQDMVSGGREANSRLEAMLTVWRGKNIFQKDTGKRRKRLAWRGDDEAVSNFKEELTELIDTLYNVPSIGVWVIFNEAWGQHDAKGYAQWLKQYDPSRSIDEASGWYMQGGGDLQTTHIYGRKLYIQDKILNQRVYGVSEYGGKTLGIQGHSWSGQKTMGYGSVKDPESFTKEYEELVEKELIPLIKEGCGAAIYTQITDVEREINGLVTYDRKVVKGDVDRIYHVNKMAEATL